MYLAIVKVHIPFKNSWYRKKKNGIYDLWCKNEQTQCIRNIEDKRKPILQISQNMQVALTAGKEILYNVKSFQAQDNEKGQVLEN